MASFESKELMFGFTFDNDPDQEGVFLQLAGCNNPSKAKVSCGPTQNKTLSTPICKACKVNADGLQVDGAEGLKILQQALRDMLNQLEPVEKELRAFEAAQEEKAAEGSDKEADEESSS